LYLEGELGDDDLRFSPADVLDIGFCLANQGGIARFITSLDHIEFLLVRTDAVAVEQAASRQVRPRDQLHQVSDFYFFTASPVLRHIHHCLADFTQVVGQDIGRHAHRDPCGAVDEQVGYAGWEHHRLAEGAIEVGSPIDRVFFQVFKHALAQARQARLGVTHGCRPIAIDRAVVALPVDQRHAHGEILRHAHHRIIH